MMAIWTIFIFLLSNVLVWAYSAAALYGSWLIMQRIRNNRNLNNIICRVIVTAIIAAGLFVSYFIMNWLMTFLMPICGMSEDTPGFVFAIAAILNILTMIVVPIVGVGWVIFIIYYVALDRCPNCYYTEPLVLNQAVKNVIVKTTKTTKYSDGSKDTDVSYERQKQIDFTMKCPECGTVWMDKGLQIER